MNYKPPVMSSQSGFTLIELVMVIVILGILAAVAIPQFTDLSGDARSSSLAAIGGGISSASQMNYSQELINDTGTVIASCQAATALLQGIANYAAFQAQHGGVSITNDATAAATDGTTHSCSLAHTDGSTATFVVTAVQ